MRSRRGIFIIVSIALGVLFSVYVIVMVVSKNSESSVFGDPLFPNEDNKPQVELQEINPIASAPSSIRDKEQELNLAGQPDRVQIAQVISETTTEDGGIEKIDLMTDGSIRTTITNSKGDLLSHKSEFIGTITQVEHDMVYVDLSRGGNKILIIPEDSTVIHDKEQAGWKPGVEVNWIIDQSGKVTNIQLKK